MLNLNAQQQKAVQSTSRITYVDAGAGTGKTTIIKTKISSYIKSGVKPWCIIVLAFNKEIVEELKTELTYEFGANIANKMNIYTIHGYACKVLARNKVVIRLKLFDEEVFEKFIRSSWSKFKKDNKLKSRNPKEARDEISFIVGMVNKCRENNSCAKEYDKIYREFYKTLKKELKQTGAYDFARTLKVAKNKLIQTCNPSYVFVDEFQDTSETRFNFIKALVGEYNYLFAVGDENQQILGWSGIKNVNLEKLKQCYKQELSIYKLDHSYRLPPLLAQKSNNLLSLIHSGETKRLIGCNNVKSVFDIKKFNSPKEETEWCVKYIKDLIDKGIEAKNIGVLYRNANIISKEIVETKVCCSTIHKAKGLEFDYVILLGLEEGIFPSKNSNLDEEMRVFYVGMTRAKRSLIITYIEDSYRNNIYVKPSRFLQYIK